MKRILFFTAVLTVMFTSCQKSLDDGSSVRSDAPEMRLKLNVKSPTKAFTESTAEVLKTNGFKVAAVKADHSVLFNAAVTYNSADGTFSVPGKHYFFPTVGTMSFYATYPTTQAIVVDTDGKATITYSQNTDTDLIAAKAVNVESTNDPVLMTFSHLLSQVSVKAQGTDPAYTYKLKSVTITDAESGTYSFADGIWTPGATTQEYDVFTATDESGKAISASSLEAVGSAMSFIPGDVKINAVWDVFDSEGLLISANDVTVDASLEQGKSVRLNLFLPADPDMAGEIFFMCKVGAWTPSSGDVIVKKPYEPELIEGGVFTVNNNGTDSDTDDDKKVKFTKGNLYWNGKEFRCEENQYDYPTAWAVNHVGHFFWSKDARVAYAANYVAANTTYGITPAVGDTFFAADDGAIDGLTVLSKEEWQYLIDNNAVAKNSSGKNTITIAGKKCVVLKPDGFSGTVADSYTAADWATAEATSGLVALPFAGSRNDTSFNYAGSYGGLWSCTPASGGAGDAYYAYFDFSAANTNYYGRNYGYSVRLVSVQ